MRPWLNGLVYGAEVAKMKYGKSVDTYSLGLVLSTGHNDGRLPFVPEKDRISAKDMAGGYTDLECRVKRFRSRREEAGQLSGCVKGNTIEWRCYHSEKEC